MSKEKNKKLKPCVIGLGYVGLPIFLRLAKRYKSICYDNNQKRISALQSGKDIFGEVKRKDLNNHKLNFTFNLGKIKDCNLFIITVPTPVFKNKRPISRRNKR